MRDKRWNILQPSPELVRQLAVGLDIGHLLATILANRQISTVDEAHRFLSPSLDHLYDPFLMKGMGKAVDILVDATRKDEGILIFGDYDVDGVTATALLHSYLRKFTPRISHYIPHRVEEGYGLQEKKIEEFRRQGGGLVLTVDCGISNAAEVTKGRDLGLTFIITDHHEPPSDLPPADAILNPRQKDCPYPFKDLAGVGIAFKLLQGLWDRLGPGNSGLETGPETSFTDYLDLVALGTVADIVPLRDENRIFVKEGLKQLVRPLRPGIRALKSVSGLKDRQVESGNISFALAPRINAAGRLGRADTAVDLLLENHSGKAMELAVHLNEENRRRQGIEAQIHQEAQDNLRENPSLQKDSFLVLTSPTWHPGVIGIVASKLAERFSRPCILISTKIEPAKGSARSILNLDLYSSLQGCQHLLEAFGGHPYAAGLSIQSAQIPVLQQALNTGAQSEERDLTLGHGISIDACLSFADLRSPVLAELSRLMPFGHTNPAPTFVTEGVSLVRTPTTFGKNHLRLTLQQKAFKKQAVGFNMGDFAESLSPDFPFDIAYSPDFDIASGGRPARLRLSDIHLPYSLEYADDAD